MCDEGAAFFVFGGQLLQHSLQPYRLIASGLPADTFRHHASIPQGEPASLHTFIGRRMDYLTVHNIR